MISKNCVMIPKNVYAADGNFYDSRTRKGMGTVFYNTWKEVISEFPSRPEYETKTENDLRTRYRLWNPEAQTIELCADELAPVFAEIAMRETSIYEETYPCGEVLQILKQNALKDGYKVLFTLVRGSAE